MGEKQDINFSISEKIYDTIRTRIQNGTYPLKSRLPSVSAISTEFKIAHVTAFRIIRRLAESGYVESSSGKGGRKGTFVREKFPGRKISVPRQVATLIYPLEARSYGDTFWADILNSVQLNLAQNRIITTNYAFVQEKYLASFYYELHKGNIEAVIACQFTPEQVIKKVVGSEVPLILLNYIIKQKGIRCLIPDHEKIGKESAEMMVKSGFKKFYFYRLPKKGQADPLWKSFRYSTHRRIEEAFTKKLKELKATPPIYIQEPSKKQHAKFVDNFINEKDAALFTISGGTAQIIYEKMLLQDDSRIKKHGLIWIEDYGSDLSFAPALSGWRLNIENIGKSAVNAINIVWNGNNPGQQIEILPVEWIERTST